MRFHAGETSDFIALIEMRNEGMTDIAAMITRFAAAEAIGEMDCLYAYWATDKPDGFNDAEVGAIAGLMPKLAVAMKCASLAHIAETLVETYLGRDPGRRVLKGLIRRGVADRINAVLWFSDLRNFTRLSEQVAPEQIIPLLDDYAEAAIAAIYENGGDVLKLMGDGILAIFAMTPAAEACSSALASHALLQRGFASSTNAVPATITDYAGLSWPPYRGCVLRQYWQSRAAGFHGGRSGRQRSGSHCGIVPIGRARCAHFSSLCRCCPRRGAKPARFRRPLCVARCQAAAGTVYPGS